MVTIELRPVPLTAKRFAPYGDVIEARDSATSAMNDARFDRFDGLCSVDVGDGDVAVGIAVCRTATKLPYRVELIERHPLGSQAFVPLSPCRMIVVVAPPSEDVATEALKAFVTDGTQGINYRPGTWHMPLIAFEEGQRYLVIDRGGKTPNLDLHMLDETVMLIKS